MSHRPYPDPDRARRHLNRHVHDQGTPTPALSPASARVMRSLVDGVSQIRIPTPVLPRADMSLLLGQLGVALERETARSAPGVLALWRLAHPNRPLTR